MKESVDAAAVGRATEPETFANRKLIRPSLTREHAAPAERRERPERAERGERPAGPKKSPPPDQTHAENFYYQKQMQAKTPMTIVLKDGEQIHGVIEWYDRACIKVNRTGGQPNLLIYKACIKYMYKDE
ncbi:MAG TPA: RNA chaperone Hfq [Terriglobales bacterium]|jgi:sRNA-binding regulator protein Hfq|nr:RNA chaperone Hfq [Terriglobales bacterium]